MKSPGRCNSTDDRQEQTGRRLEARPMCNRRNIAHRRPLRGGHRSCHGIRPLQAVEDDSVGLLEHRLDRLQENVSCQSEELVVIQHTPGKISLVENILNCLRPSLRGASDTMLADVSTRPSRNVPRAYFSKGMSGLLTVSIEPGMVSAEQLKYFSLSSPITHASVVVRSFRQKTMHMAYLVDIGELTAGELHRDGKVEVNVTGGLHRDGDDDGVKLRRRRLALFLLGRDDVLGLLLAEGLGCLGDGRDLVVQQHLGLRLLQQLLDHLGTVT